VRYPHSFDDFFSLSVKITILVKLWQLFSCYGFTNVDNKNLVVGARSQAVGACDTCGLGDLLSSGARPSSFGS
jgi:hypothetical protein